MKDLREMTAKEFCENVVKNRWNWTLLQFAEIMYGWDTEQAYSIIHEFQKGYEYANLIERWEAFQQLATAIGSFNGDGLERIANRE